MKLLSAAVLTALVSLSACSAPSARDGSLSVELARDTNFTGRGNAEEPLLYVNLSSDSSFVVKSVSVNLDADAGDVALLRIKREGETLASAKVSPGRNGYKLRFKAEADRKLTLVLCADITPAAREGGLVSADIFSVNVSGHVVEPVAPAPGYREILLCRKCLYKPGDYGSDYWRIPAILQLSDGTLLTVNDRRNASQEDLPNEIDVVSRYSTDGGRSWSEPVYIAKNGGRMFGFGDPGLAELEDGTVICTFCGGQRLDKSCWEDPQRSYFSVSKDHGRTWSEPRDITSSIWGPDPVNPFCKRYNSSFFSSGNSLVLKNSPHKGRMLVANVCTYDSWRGLCNHAVYTDDGGESWHVSQIAFADKGDEAKMVELNDGRILMSIRQNGNRAFTLSEDGGETWGEPGRWEEICTNACNGDLIRYDDGTLLHSVPNSMKRENVSVFLSFDEGRTWPEHKSICHGPSVYSSLTVLADGTIGAYLEEDPTGACELWYENFSLSWLRRR
ncbi:MAG: glycoside hydrolase [Bacteroidales bacterium]|nr:glycoside hydrolase [Bacteroidales bacterium]